MKRIFIIAALFASNAFADVAPLIVGGVKAKKGEFPYIVSLQDKDGHVCGGSLIKKNWILTAGHCVSDDIKLKKIVVGMLSQNRPDEGESMTIKKIVQHPQYEQGFDFALIQLKKNSKQAYVPVNTQELMIDDTIGKQTESIAAGWGLTKETGKDMPKLLMKVSLPLVSQAECERGYPGQLNSAMLCAGFPDGKKDSCSGDSGGPLIVDNNGTALLVGVVSWGEGCARPQRYGVYAKVSAVADWIAQTVQ